MAEKRWTQYYNTTEEASELPGDPTIEDALQSPGLFFEFLVDYTDIDPEYSNYNYQLIRVNEVHENYEYLRHSGDVGVVHRLWLDRALSTVDLDLAVVYTDGRSQNLGTLIETQDGSYYVYQFTSEPSGPGSGDRYLRDVRASHLELYVDYPYEQIGIVAVQVGDHPILQFPKLFMFYDDVIPG